MRLKRPTSGVFSLRGLHIGHPVSAALQETVFVERCQERVHVGRRLLTCHQDVGQFDSSGAVDEPLPQLGAGAVEAEIHGPAQIENHDFVAGFAPGNSRAADSINGSVGHGRTP